MASTNISGTDQRKIHAAIRQVTSAKLASLDKAAGQRLLGELEALKTHVFMGIDKYSAAPAPKPSLLKLVNDNVQLDAVETHNPSEFFTTRKGLWISDDFKSRVLSKAKQVENLNLHPVTLVSRELTKSLYDKQITPELGENYIFDESVVCVRIEQLISKQPNGEKGDLLNNGYANLFYVAGCVVHVYWSSDYRKWRVLAWELDDGRWSAGRRVFSRN